MSEDERRILTTRHHWFLLIGAGWGYLLLLVLGIALEVYANARFEVLRGQLGLSADQLTIALLVLALVLVVYPIVALAIIFVRRQFDQVIITNYRVLHVSGIFSKRVMDSSLEKVNDILLTQSFLGRMFDYGNVEILTASEVGVNVLKWVSKPVALKRALLEAKQELESGPGFRSSIPDLIAKLAELRDKLRDAKDAYWSEQVDIQQQVATAWLLYAEGKPDDALKAMSAAADTEDKTEKHPVTPGVPKPARELYGVMLLESGKPGEALAAFEATLKKEPNRLGAYAGAAKAAEKAGENAKAQEYYRKVLSIAGDADKSRAEVGDARAFLTKKS
jgi:hypothetical protein